MSLQISSGAVLVDVKVENDTVEVSIEDKEKKEGDKPSIWLKLTCCLKKKVENTS